MKIAKFVLPALAAGFMASSASAATMDIQVDANNTIAGVTANSLLVDGEGVDWTGTVLLVELSGGSVYNGAPDSDGPQAGFWGVPGFEILEWDTWFGVPNDATNGIAGGAGDLGNNVKSTAGTNISVTAFNTTATDTAAARVGNVSLSDDAVGTWSIIQSFGDGTLLRDEGTVEGGALVPEPASLALLGLGGLAVLRRR